MTFGDIVEHRVTLNEQMQKQRVPQRGLLAVDHLEDMSQVLDWGFVLEGVVSVDQGDKSLEIAIVFMCLTRAFLVCK